MQEPNYILKANEAVIVPKANTGGIAKIRTAIWIIVAIIIIGSFVLGNNIFSELSWTVRALLISLVIGTFFINTSERVPSPFEMWFYDDCLVLYREKHFYSKKITRKEYDKFFYKDIRECQYQARTKRINISGVVEGIWYNYRKDGSLPSEPSYHKTTDSIRYFYTTFAREIDFVKEIESHSPIKVNIENN